MPTCPPSASGASTSPPGSQATRPPTTYSVPTRYLDAETTRLMFRFPPDMQRLPVNPNHLNDQRLVHYFQQDWSNVVR